MLEGVLARLCPQAQLPVKALRVGVWAVDGCRYWDSVLHLRRESVLDRHGGQNVGERTRSEWILSSSLPPLLAVTLDRGLD